MTNKTQQNQVQVIGAGLAGSEGGVAAPVGCDHPKGQLETMYCTKCGEYYTAAAEAGGHDPHDDFSEQNNPFPVSPLRDQVAGIGRVDYPAAAEVGEWKETAQSNAMQVLADRNAELARNRESLWNKLNAADKKLKEIEAATIERCAQEGVEFLRGLAGVWKKKNGRITRFVAADCLEQAIDGFAAAIRALKDIKE